MEPAQAVPCDFIGVLMISMALALACDSPHCFQGLWLHWPRVIASWFRSSSRFGSSCRASNILEDAAKAEYFFNQIVARAMSDWARRSTRC